MKVGVVNFGSGSVEITSILKELITNSTTYGYSLVGVEFDREASSIQTKELHNEYIEKSKITGEVILRSFPEAKWYDEDPKLQELDTLIVFGRNEIKVNSKRLRVLHVPVSIYNDHEDSQYTLGYDTALNSVVSYIEKTRDTISSLSYHKVRVFFVQIPGDKQSLLLKNAALATDAHVVKGINEEEVQAVKDVIRTKEQAGQEYAFLVMDHSVDPDKLASFIVDEFDVDWKGGVIDEAQCGGPFPTAFDRVLAKNITRELLTWIDNNQPTGHLVCENDRVLVK